MAYNHQFVLVTQDSLLQANQNQNILMQANQAIFQENYAKSQNEQILYTQ